MAIGEIDLDLMRGVSYQTQPVEEMEFDGNFISRVRELVNRIMSQMSRVSENDRKQIETLKREYRVASRDGADMQRKIGNAAPWIAGVAFAASLVPLLFTNTDDRAIMKTLTEQVPGVANGLYTSRLQAKQMEYQSVSSLRSTEIANKGSKTGPDQSKQDMLEFFRSTLDLMKRASTN